VKNERKKDESMTMEIAMSGMTGGEKPKGRLRGLKTKGPHVPVTEDPRAELRRLVRMHRNWTKTATSLTLMITDREFASGDVVKCTLPDDVRADLKATAKGLKRQASALASSMTKELRKLPIWSGFLSKMYGMGPVIGAYFVAEIDISMCTKISQLRMFCGTAVINGRLVRRTKGEKSRFNSQMRVRLFQLMTGMWKNAAAHVDKETGEVTRGSTTTKYLEVWRGAWHRGQHDERYDLAANTWGDRKGAKMLILRRAMWKAADVLLEDLYVVWRAMEGLPVWPSYYTAKLTAGYEHGGSVAKEIGPRMLTVEEALDLVGDVGGRPADATAIGDLTTLRSEVEGIEDGLETDEDE
jgi:hypothetical protein